MATYVLHLPSPSVSEAPGETLQPLHLEICNERFFDVARQQTLPTPLARTWNGNTQNTGIALIWQAAISNVFIVKQEITSTLSPLNIAYIIIIIYAPSTYVSIM